MEKNKLNIAFVGLAGVGQCSHIAASISEFREIAPFVLKEPEVKEIVLRTDYPITSLLPLEVLVNSRQRKGKKGRAKKKYWQV